jgi:FtsP/CotA-like multicopper oxidase with cupredoxin domain
MYAVILSSLLRLTQFHSTAVHWHGIDQKNTTWNDGIVGISQCGIPAGASYTYEFNTTEQRGTYWYHSHLSTQYTDGMFGPLVSLNAYI